MEEKERYAVLTNFAETEQDCDAPKIGASCDPNVDCQMGFPCLLGHPWWSRTVCE